MLRREVIEQELSNQVIPYVQKLLTRDDMVKVDVVPDYYLTNYDGLFLFSFQQLVSLCDSLHVDVTDCRLKYQIVSRLTLFDKMYGILNGFSFPPIPDKRVVDEFRLQLLQIDGIPGRFDPLFAIQKAKRMIVERPSKLPYSLGKTVVFSLGSIKSCETFNTKFCVYPVGYNCKVLYFSVDSPLSEEWYDCWIQDGNDRPIFSILRNGSILFSLHDINNLWKQVQDHCRAKEPSMDFPPVHGEDMFGLTNPVIQMLIECLPGSANLTNYIFVYYRDFVNRLNEISRREAEVKRLEMEYNSLQAKTIESCLQRGVIEIDGPTIHGIAQAYCMILRERRTLQRLQSLEMKTRMVVMNELNQEVLKNSIYSNQKGRRKSAVKGNSLQKEDDPSMLTIPASPPKKRGRVIVTVSDPMNKRISVQQTMVSDELYQFSNLRRDRPTPLTEGVTTRKQKRVMENAASEQVNPFQRSRLSSRELYYQTQFYCMKSIANGSGGEEAFPYKPSIPQSQPVLSSTSFSFHSLSTLPHDMVNTILSMWSFITTFSKVFQLPLVSYQEFEQSILHPTVNPLFDSVMSFVLMGCFCQLKALLSQSDRDATIAGWRPFYNRRLNRYTWPEFARILFVCKVWTESGRDPAKLVRDMVDETNRGLDYFMVADPMNKVSKKNESDLVEKEVDAILNRLKHVDAIQFLHSLAMIKRLRTLACAEFCLNPVSIQQYPTYQKIIQKPMDLSTLEHQLIQGDYIQNEEFNKELFIEDLSLLWLNMQQFFENDESMITKAAELQEEAMYLVQTWIEDCYEDKRGPWDEAQYYNQGCKLCLESNEEMHEEEMVTCSICEVSFHLSCVVPPLQTIPNEGWTCGLCKGFTSQERWKNETVNTQRKDQFDSIRYNAAVYEQLPLRQAMGNHTGKPYEYLTLFDPFITNPIFFGYETTSSTDILHLPFKERLRQLACKLAYENPWDMPLESRVAVASTVFDLARDLPEVRHYVEDSLAAVENLNLKCNSIVANETAAIRHICDSMGSLVSLRTGRKRKAIKSKIDNSSKQTLVNRLPVSFDTITIHSLGSIKVEKGYVDKYMIYPINYHATITLPDNALFHCEILDGGNHPLFQVRNDQGFVRSAPSAQTVWIQVMIDLYPDNDLSELNGYEYFGFAIEEVVRSIFQLPNAEFFQFSIKYPLPTIQIKDSIRMVTQSQWHPACIGYRMEETNHPIDPQVKSPIFYNFSEDTCSFCHFCHMPETESTPLIQTTIPDITASMAHYLSHRDVVLQNFVEAERDEIEEEGWLTKSECSLHEHCEVIYHRLMGNTIRQLRKAEIEYVQDQVNKKKTQVMFNLDITNSSLGVDKKDNEFFQFRGDPSCIFVHSLDSWYVLPSNEELQAFIQQLNQTNSAESALHSVLSRVRLSKQPSYDPSFFQIVDLLRPRALEFLSHILPASFRPIKTGSGSGSGSETTIEYKHCETCGCILHSITQHCSRCHYDFEPALFPNHVCCPLPPTNPMLSVAKHHLLLLEYALHGMLFTKKMKNLWIPARRAAWEMKVRRAQTVEEVLTCVFLVEHVIYKGGFTRYYKQSLPSSFAQSHIKSISSLLLRIFCLDDILRYTIVPFEITPEPEPVPIKRKSNKKEK